MKTRRILALILSLALVLTVMAACKKDEGTNGGGNTTTTTDTAKTDTAKTDTDKTDTSTDTKVETKTEDTKTEPAVSKYAAYGLDDNLRFTETRKITVEVYDRANEGGSNPTDNYYTNYIKEGMLRDHNVEVTYKAVGRWSETDDINNLLGAGDAPDVCVTYSYPTIQTYASMGAVHNLAQWVDGPDGTALFPNLWGFLGETNLHWDRDPDTGEIWAIEARLFNNSRINTFVREDWITKLGIAAPTTLDQFEAMLVAFRDNAETLLGAEADQMIPFSVSYDVGWRADHLVSMFVPNDITDKDIYVYGYDDRHMLFPNFKEGIRVLNKWYNDGLIWKDFALYGAGDTTEDNLMKSGYVGSFIHNWDYPYRNGDDGIHAQLKSLVGPDAAYIAVEPFKNDAGLYKKFIAGPIDRKVFLPITNSEPLAGLLYLDWLAKFENRSYLQVGDEGVTHETQPDGAIKTIASSGETIMNSPNNIDYTIVINGLDLGDKSLTARSLALGYAGVDARFIEVARAASTHDGREGKNVQAGKIESEEGVDEALKGKRDTLLDKSVVAPVADFDSTYDSGMKDYLGSGGQNIINERLEKWEATYGSSTMLP